MKKLLVLFIILLSVQSQAQEEKQGFFKSIYTDFLKYGTVYGAGDISNSVEAEEQTYFLRTNPDGSLYSIPDVVNNTEVFPFRVDGKSPKSLADFSIAFSNNVFLTTDNSISALKQALLKLEVSDAFKPEISAK